MGFDEPKLDTVFESSDRRLAFSASGDVEYWSLSVSRKTSNTVDGMFSAISNFAELSKCSSVSGKISSLYAPIARFVFCEGIPDVSKTDISKSPDSSVTAENVQRSVSPRTKISVTSTLSRARTVTYCP